jgi:hypothetical protein
VSVAVIVAVAVNSDGRREVLGMTVGASEAETFWTAFLRTLVRRGLRGVKLVISDAHEGLKAAVAKVLHASWQRCRVHFMRNVLAHAGKQGRRVVAAFIATAFAQEDSETARSQWRQVADQIRPKVAKLAALMDEAETDEDPLDQSAGTAERRYQAPHRGFQCHVARPLDRPFIVLFEQDGADQAGNGLLIGEDADDPLCVGREAHFDFLGNRLNVLDTSGGAFRGCFLGITRHKSGKGDDALVGGDADMGSIDAGLEFELIENILAKL